MNVSGKGVATIILFLVLIPLLVDLVLIIVIPAKDHFSMTAFLLPRYTMMLPVYLVYLVIAFGIMYLINKWKKSRQQ
jgi:hypothetical protein